MEAFVSQDQEVRFTVAFQAFLSKARDAKARIPDMVEQIRLFARGVYGKGPLWVMARIYLPKFGAYPKLWAKMDKFFSRHAVEDIVAELQQIGRGGSISAFKMDTARLDGFWLGFEQFFAAADELGLTPDQKYGLIRQVAQGGFPVEDIAYHLSSPGEYAPEWRQVLNFLDHPDNQIRMNQMSLAEAEHRFITIIGLLQKVASGTRELSKLPASCSLLPL